VHLAGFIIRIYHSARSSECQIYFGWFQYTAEFTISVRDDGRMCLIWFGCKVATRNNKLLKDWVTKEQ